MQTEIQGICAGMDIKMWDNDRKNINLTQAEFIYIGSLSRDSVFNVAA